MKKLLNLFILAGLILSCAAHAGIGSGPFNQSAVAITGGTITGITGVSAFGTVAASSAVSGPAIRGSTGYYLGSSGGMIFSVTAPTISSCGTVASIIVSNGTAAFSVLITGTNPPTCSLTMPAAANFWSCFAGMTGSGNEPADKAIKVTSSSPTSILIERYTVSTGISSSLGSPSNYHVNCIAF